MTTAPPSGRSFSASVCWDSSARPSSILRNTPTTFLQRWERVWCLMGGISNKELTVYVAAHRTERLPETLIMCAPSFNFASVVSIQVWKTACLHKETNCCCYFARAITLNLLAENLWDSYSIHIVKPLIIWRHDCCSILLSGLNKCSLAQTTAACWI